MIFTLTFQYLDVERFDEALLAWRNATLLKHDHVSAWVNSIILLDNLGAHYA